MYAKISLIAESTDLSVDAETKINVHRASYTNEFIRSRETTDGHTCKLQMHIHHKYPGISDKYKKMLTDMYIH